MAAKKKKKAPAKGKRAAKKRVPRTWRGKRYTAPKNKSKRLKGPGKKGSGKRMIYRSGGNQNVLNAWRSLGQDRRNSLKKAARTNPNKRGLTALIRRRVMAPRKAKGKSGQTGVPWNAGASAAPVAQGGSPSFNTPQERKIPSRMRGWKV